MLYKLLKSTNPCKETRFVKVYNLKQDNINYKIIISKRTANRRSIIHCIDNQIEWEQFPILHHIWGTRMGEKLPIYKFNKPKGETVIFVIKGNPLGVTGLDDGLFKGIKNFDNKYINVMSLKYFKQFKV